MLQISCRRRRGDKQEAAENDGFEGRKGRRKSDAIAIEFRYNKRSNIEMVIEFIENVHIARQKSEQIRAYS